MTFYNGRLHTTKNGDRYDYCFSPLLSLIPSVNKTSYLRTLKCMEARILLLPSKIYWGNWFVCQNHSNWYMTIQVFTKSCVIIEGFWNFSALFKCHQVPFSIGQRAVTPWTVAQPILMPSIIFDLTSLLVTLCMN
jgi:hypothetical protein